MTERRSDRLRPVAVTGLAVAAVLLVAVWVSTAPRDARPAPATTIEAPGLGGPETSTSIPAHTTTALHDPATTSLGADAAPRFDPESQRYVAESSIFSVRYPEGWHLAAGSSTLIPDIGWEVISLGTFPLRPGGRRCPQFPEQALEDMTPDDALAALFVGGGDGAPPGRVFGPDFPPTQPDSAVLDCLERDDALELRWGESWDHGRQFYVLVAFGADASAETRLETWEVLNSLTLSWPPERMAIGPRGKDGCDPPSPYDSGALGVEVLLTPVPFEAWALLPATAPPVAGDEVVITWSVAAAEVTSLFLVHPAGGTIFPERSPPSRSWNPADGVTYDTLTVFPEPGCWQVSIFADGQSLAPGWLEVR